MKTTLDLPDHLVRQAKQRALQQGCTLRELVAGYIRQGLHGVTPPCPSSDSAVVCLDATGLPVFRAETGKGEAPPLDITTALRLEQDGLMREDLGRAGLPA